jgi:hypothetical protein
MPMQVGNGMALALTGAELGGKLNEATRAELLKILEIDTTPLDAFDLSDADQRWRFLWRLSEIEEEGLLLAVSHVWASLAPPRAHRVSSMAKAIGVASKGKLALYEALKAFLVQFEAECQPPELPSPKNFHSAEEWQAVVGEHFAAGDAAMDRVISRYSSILNGEAPVGASPMEAQETVILIGPWKKASPR